MDTIRKSALKVDSGRKIPCRTGESNLPQQHAGIFYQLSYMPASCPIKDFTLLLLVQM